MTISFNTKNAKDSIKYSKKHILDKTDELSLFQQYVGNIKLKQAFCSPLREDDNPSFSLFQTKEGNILFKDHATGESGDVFKFLRMLWNCSLNEVYKRIIDDFPTDQVNLERKNKIREYQSDLDIAIKRKHFDLVDACYWQKYFIEKSTLYKFKVWPISYYTINGIKQSEWQTDDPMYAYKVNDKFKIYRPLTKYKKDKWRGNLTKNNVFGYEQLPKKGDLLIITKSLKDVMVLYELGYNAIAPSSESTEISKSFIDELSSRFKRIVLFFDNDEAGIKNSTKYVEKYQFQRMQINPSEGIKDISDFREVHKDEWTRNYIEYLLDGNE